MKKTFVSTIVVYLYHLIFIVMTIMLIEDYGDALMTISLFCNAVFVFIWTAIEIKRGIPRSVWFHFAAGTVMEVILNVYLYGVRIEVPSGTFADLVQFFYVCEIVAVAFALGILNLIVRFARRRGDKREVS